MPLRQKTAWPPRFAEEMDIRDTQHPQVKRGSVCGKCCCSQANVLNVVGERQPTTLRTRVQTMVGIVASYERATARGNHAYVGRAAVGQQRHVREVRAGGVAAGQCSLGRGAGEGAHRQRCGEGGEVGEAGTVQRLAVSWQVRQGGERARKWW